jgi:hypothetical protein
MGDVIGFLELAGWALAIVGLAAGVTFAVIKLFPGREQPSSGQDTGGGSSS